MVKKTIFIILLLLLSSFAFAEETPLENDCLLYFYGSDCTRCAEPEQKLEQLKLQYPGLDIRRFDVYRNNDFKLLLDSYFENYGISEESQGLPVVFIGQTYFIGDEAIINLLETKITTSENYDCPKPIPITALGVAGPKSPPNVVERLTLPNLFVHALRDSFSPVIISMFLILLALLASLREREEIRRRSVFFVGGALVLYALYAFGVVDGFEISKAPRYFTKLIGLFAVFMGIWIIRNFVLGKKGLVATLSKASKTKVRHRANLILSDVGFALLGLAAAIFTVPLTSKALPLMRALFWEPVWTTTLIPKIIFYLLILALPMILLGVLVYLVRYSFEYLGELRGGGSERRIEIWQRHHIKLFRLIVSLVAIIFGMYLVFV